MNTEKSFDSKPAWLYLMHESQGIGMKIGVSFNALNRQRQLKLDNIDVQNSVAFLVPDFRMAYGLEKTLHAKFAQCRISRRHKASGYTEWFHSQCANEAIAFLASPEVASFYGIQGPYTLSGARALQSPFETATRGWAKRSRKTVGMATALLREALLRRAIWSVKKDVNYQIVHVDGSRSSLYGWGQPNRIGWENVPKIRRGVLSPEGEPLRQTLKFISPRGVRHVDRGIECGEYVLLTHWSNPDGAIGPEICTEWSRLCGEIPFYGRKPG